MKAVMYHYVRPSDNTLPYFKNLAFADFVRQLDYFERNYGFVSQQDFVASFERPNNLPHGVILTFDDGLSCHYDFVFRELRRRGLWGIFYVPTRPYHSGKILDVHRTHLLLGGTPARLVYDYLATITEDRMFDEEKRELFQRLTYDTQQNDNFTLLVKRTLNYFLKYEFREAVLDRLMQQFVPNETELAATYYASPAQLKEMHEAGMIIGSHTVNHPVMSRLSADQQRREIEHSFDFLEEVVGSFHHKTFCYPYGGFHTFTAETEKMLSEVGCLYSFNVEQRDVTVNDVTNRPQALPRYDCNQFAHGQVRPPLVSQQNSRV